jgi:hypothetical protein
MVRGFLSEHFIHINVDEVTLPSHAFNSELPSHAFNSDTFH